MVTEWMGNQEGRAWVSVSWDDLQIISRAGSAEKWPRSHMAGVEAGLDYDRGKWCFWAALPRSLGRTENME